MDTRDPPGRGLALSIACEATALVLTHHPGRGRNPMRDSIPGWPNAEQDAATFAISPELEAKILRHFHVERWRVGTIARQLGIHHATTVICGLHTKAPGWAIW